MQLGAAGVSGQHVVGTAEQVGRVRAQALKQHADGGADRPGQRLRRHRGTAGRLRRQRLQVLVLFILEAQRAGQRVDDRGARPSLPAAFEPRVVVDAHPGERRDLLASQAGRAARADAGWQARVLRADALAPGAQEASSNQNSPTTMSTPRAADRPRVHQGSAEEALSSTWG